MEYDLIAVLLSVAGVVALTNMGASLQNMFTSVSMTLNSAVAPHVLRPAIVRGKWAWARRLTVTLRLTS
ncbi:MAG: Flp family type IVb pilin [Alphaproteobacteria bacterium]